MEEENRIKILTSRTIAYLSDLWIWNLLQQSIDSKALLYVFEAICQPL